MVTTDVTRPARCKKHLYGLLVRVKNLIDHYHEHLRPFRSSNTIMSNRENVIDALYKSEEWLEANKKTFISETDTGVKFKDNFADLLILELSHRWDYVDLRIPERRWHYFAVKPVIVPADYPEDNDTNAVAFSIIKPNESRAKVLIDEILACKNADGIVQVHLDPNRPRIAPEVSANILSLFYCYGRGHEVQESLSYLLKAMALEEYEESRYYFLPEPLFFYSWRLLCIASSSSIGTVDNRRLPKELHSLRDHLIRRVSARLGTAKDNALCPAIRILICHSLGIKNEVDVQILLDLQEKDGSFGDAWYVRYGSAGIKISHRAFGVVVATAALRRVKQHKVGMKRARVNGVNGINGTKTH
ncbi:unnamed protein product [Periconia digitata]|uniref:Uncharacterized protein n=1 Tax=Periconia digitata TaxID=1303443 RepID=A0A9W4XP25_9PLEO|nr:unnamed protein product [Periconia digitata]